MRNGTGTQEDLSPEDFFGIPGAEAVDPALIQHLAHPDMWRWEAGDDLDDGRTKLAQIMANNDITVD